jgi:DNA-binding LytR/AlgR family response regulator
VRILIVEDEAVVARRIEQFCRRILGGRLERIGVAESFDAARASLDVSPIDVLLLDLNLEGQDGMGLLHASAAAAFHTIIVSANTEHALRAFDHGVIDFVAKPFTLDRLALALGRVADQHGRAVQPAKFLAVKKHGRVEIVPLASVAYIQGAHNYSELVLTDGRRELHDKSLDRLMAVLPPGFERIHKSYVVRFGDIVAIHLREGSQYEAELKNGAFLPVGRTRCSELRARLM